MKKSEAGSRTVVSFIKLSVKKIKPSVKNGIFVFYFELMFGVYYSGHFAFLAVLV